MSVSRVEKEKQGHSAFQINLGGSLLGWYRRELGLAGFEVVYTVL